MFMYLEILVLYITLKIGLSVGTQNIYTVGVECENTFSWRNRKKKTRKSLYALMKMNK